MERTLKLLLEQAKFTTTRKGYDQQEVDDFLDQAVEMAAAMEARLAEAAGGEVSGAGEGDGAPGRSEAEIQAEVDAKVEAAVQARLAEMPAPVAAPAVDDEAVAEEARRTLVLAQRTADAAVAEAREEADSLLTKAREEADSLVTVARTEAARLEESTKVESEQRRREIDAEIETARGEARSRLAAEIRSLEEARDNLRSDVSVLESHAEEQRVQLRSAASELQRLLEDPAAFRLAPMPELRAVVIPDLSDLSEPSDLSERSAPSPSIEDGGVDGSGADVVMASADGSDMASEDADDPVLAEARSAQAQEGAASIPVGERGASPGTAELFESTGSTGLPDAAATDTDESDDSVGADSFGAIAPETVGDVTPSADEPALGSGSDAGDLGDPDGAEPVVDGSGNKERGGDEPGDEEPGDGGPPTAPVPVLELGFTDPPPQPQPDDSDDAFLAELRKAMAEETPLGPRDDDATDTATPGFLDDDGEDRRGWRFGKRR
ncbi:MAG: DivIVA domain-containing protein [Microthrixaceae bacterium]|jgi:DivIVA domain-containing protein|nr:DivIVA domain-containing protein [Microthrixaceae bacterium]